jgi:CubicO group peptidase (beta-lactamase class C family)
VPLVTVACLRARRRRASVAGERLGTVMQERIFAPLGMDSTGFVLTAAMRSRSRGAEPGRAAPRRR